MIEFELDGTIVNANENFLNAVGYELDEIRGRHHRLFVEPEYAESAEYRQFWEKLAAGEFQAAEYKRIAKGGREIWIQATYNPIFDSRGKPSGVVKFATDITDQTLKTADYKGQMEAIGKSQAVIEFELDGTIRYANSNFLSAMGYTIDQIRGEHHRMFVEPDYADSAEYAAFWKSLAAGEFEDGVFKRLAKGGREIWIRASYNPIFDPDGRPVKVVKYASDITAQKLQTADYQGQIEAIGKSQAVIELFADGFHLALVVGCFQGLVGDVGGELDHPRRFAPGIEDRVVRRLDPDFAAALGDALVFRSLEFAGGQLFPELPVFGAFRVFGFDEQAVVPAPDLVQLVADGVQEVFVGVDDRAVQLEFDHRLRPADGVQDGVCALGFVIEHGPTLLRAPGTGPKRGEGDCIQMYVCPFFCN